MRPQSAVGAPVAVRISRFDGEAPVGATPFAVWGDSTCTDARVTTTGRDFSARAVWDVVHGLTTKQVTIAGPAASGIQSALNSPLSGDSAL